MPKQLILASKSPRRSQLLADAGIPFVVRTANTEEVYPEALDVRKVAPFLAKLKAEGARHLLEHPGELLLTADSVVILDGRIYHKPKDRAAAIDTLRLLSDNQHTVVTGCCLMDGEREEVFAGTSTVYLNPMTEREITSYVDDYEPYDKAGAYGIQEWVGLAKVRRIEGSYANIVGLPVDLVYERWVGWK